MAIKYDTIYAAHVKRAAVGIDDNPDTYILVDKAYVPIRTGIILSLFTIERNNIKTLGWAEVERARVVEKGEVEFVLVRMRAPEDRLTGLRHFLVVNREWAAAGWSLRCMAARLATRLRGLTSSVEPIRRFIPPSPPATPSIPSSPVPSIPPSSVPSNDPPASLTVSITIERRDSGDTHSLGSVRSGRANGEHEALEAEAALTMYAEVEASE